MPFQTEHKLRFGAALSNAAPLILCWTGGILLGLSYLIIPGYVFWTFFGLCLLLALIFGNFRRGYYLVILTLPVQMTHLAVSLRDMATYTVFFFPYYFPLCITIAALLVSKLLRSEPGRRTTPINGLLLFMVTYMLISLIWAPHINLGRLLSISLVLNSLIYFITKEVIIDEATLRRAAIAWIVMGLITATGVILSQWFSYNNAWHFTGTIKLSVFFGKFNSRPSGLGASDNMAGLLVSSTFMTMGLLMTAKVFTRKAFLFLMICYQAIAMILTVSRGALVGFITGLILLFFIHPSIKKKLKYVFLSFLLLISLILIAKPGYIDRILVGMGYTGNLYFSEMTTVSNQATTVAGMSERVKMWKTAFKEMVNRPYKLILGLGVGGFISYSAHPHTHSIPLSFFFDMGAIGSIIYIILVVILFMNFSHYLRFAERTDSYYIFLASVVAFVAEVGVHGLIDYDFYSYTAPMFWFPLGYVCAALNVMISENPDLSRRARV